MIPELHLQHEPLRSADLRASFLMPEAGAIVTFEGCARNHHDGQAVVELAYEAYEPMAVEQLRLIRQEALERFGLLGCLIHHRLGVVPVTEAAVVVITASAHRGPAFESVAWIMDAIKQRVPIWKRERYPDRPESWVEGDTRAM